MQKNIAATILLYCPSCGQQLHMATCADPKAVCLSCLQNHRYFLLTEEDEPAQRTATASAAKFPELADKSPMEVALFWLSDPQARSILNPQLAELLRTILDNRIAVKHRLSYCPHCAQPLSKIEDADIWVQTLSCPQNHKWAYRNGALRARFDRRNDEEKIVLHEEMTKDTALFLIGKWLNGDPVLKTNLHESVVCALKYWHDKNSSAAGMGE